MPDKAWKLSFRHHHWPKVYVWGLHFHYRPSPWARTEVALVLEFGTHNWEIVFQGRSKAPWLTKPGKPSSAE